MQKTYGEWLQAHQPEPERVPLATIKRQIRQAKAEKVRSEEAAQYRNRLPFSYETVINSDIVEKLETREGWKVSYFVNFVGTPYPLCGEVTEPRTGRTRVLWWNHDGICATGCPEHDLFISE